MPELQNINGRSELKKFNVSEDSVSMFGIDIHSITSNQALSNIDRAIKKKQSLHIGMLNAAKIVNMKRNPALRKAVLASNMILVDGVSILIASKFLKKFIPERVTGIDLMHGILAQGNVRKYKIFCLGATPEIADRTSKIISLRYPHVVLVGSQHGYFNGDDEELIAQEIADSKADVLFVAITSPKKEQFMARWNKKMCVPVVHGVGGSFDVLAGKVERAPLSWQKYGLEWLYRLKQEPGRLWKRYLVTNSTFLYMLIVEKITSRTPF